MFHGTVRFSAKQNAKFKKFLSAKPNIQKKSSHFIFHIIMLTL